MNNSELSDSRLEPLYTHQPNQLTNLLSKNIVLPNYQGRSIANIPATIGNLLASKDRGTKQNWQSPKLADDLLPYNHDVERVIFLLVDGLGYLRLQEELKTDKAGFQNLLDKHNGDCAPITSIAPSTTCVATTSVWVDGSSAAQHGMLAFSMLLPSYGLVANTLFWQPWGKLNARYGELEEWNISAEKFIPVPSIAQHLKRQNIHTTAVMPTAFIRSPLSRMQMRGATMQGRENSSDMFWQMENWLKDSSSKSYLYAYFHDLDTLSHRYSAESEVWSAVWSDLVSQLGTFLDNAKKQCGRKTMVIVSADHGHITTSKEKNEHFIEDHPVILSHLQMIPAGEPRMLILYTKRGESSAVINYVNEHLADCFYAVPSQAALDAGLFGTTDNLHPETRQRLGDVLLISKGKHYWASKDRELPFVSYHGGLEPEEMIVPLISLYLD